MGIRTNRWDIICINPSHETNERMYKCFLDTYALYQDYHGYLVDFSYYISRSLWLSLRIPKRDKHLIRSSHKLSDVIPKLSAYSRKIYHSFASEESELLLPKENKQQGKSGKVITYDLGFFKSLSFTQNAHLSKIEVMLEAQPEKRYCSFHRMLTKFFIERYETCGFDILIVDAAYLAKDDRFLEYIQHTYHINIKNKLDLTAMD